jgi:hypothetical protein
MRSVSAPEFTTGFDAFRDPHIFLFSVLFCLFVCSCLFLFVLVCLFGCLFILCVVCLLLPVSLDCSFLVAPSILSNAYSRLHERFKTASLCNVLSDASDWC